MTVALQGKTQQTCSEQRVDCKNFRRRTHRKGTSNNFDKRSKPGWMRGDHCDLGRSRIHRNRQERPGQAARQRNVQSD